MFCPKCGNKVWEQDKFCVGCGESLNVRNQNIQREENQFDGNTFGAESDAYTYQKLNTESESFQDYQLEKERLESEIREMKLKEKRYGFFVLMIIIVACLIVLLIVAIVLSNAEVKNTGHSVDNTIYQKTLAPHLKDMLLEKFRN